MCRYSISQIRCVLLLLPFVLSKLSSLYHWSFSKSRTQFFLFIPFYSLSLFCSFSVSRHSGWSQGPFSCHILKSVFPVMPQPLHMMFFSFFRSFTESLVLSWCSCSFMLFWVCYNSLPSLTNCVCVYCAMPVSLPCLPFFALVSNKLSFLCTGKQ